jgi:hypothetical protein
MTSPAATRVVTGAVHSFDISISGGEPLQLQAFTSARRGPALPPSRSPETRYVKAVPRAVGAA